MVKTVPTLDELNQQLEALKQDRDRLIHDMQHNRLGIHWYDHEHGTASIDHEIAVVKSKISTAEGMK